MIKNEVLIDGIKVLGLIILPFLLLLYLSSLFNNYDFVSAIMYFRSYFWPFLLFVLILSLSNGNIRIERVLLFIVIIQILFCIIQYVGGNDVKNMFAIHYYMRNGEIVNFMSDSVYTKSNIRTCYKIGYLLILVHSILFHEKGN